MEKVFGEHVHWGYWENPKLANGSFLDFQKATEALSKRLLSLANIKNGEKILEVGCGFGGTISLINKSYKEVKIIGINIDQRQIDRAKEKIIEKNNNKIILVQGDACELPFEDDSFDTVLASRVHFPFSR